MTLTNTSIPAYEDVAMQDGLAWGAAKSPENTGHQHQPARCSHSEPPNEDKVDHVPRPSLKTLSRYALNKLLPKLTIPIGIIVGGGILAGGGYGIHTAVMNSGPLQPDPARWALEARQRVYDACYFGCQRCDNPSYAWEACARSAKAIHAPDGTPVFCDAGVMWNWPEKERYPSDCLQIVGEDLRLEEAERAWNDNKGYYGFITGLVPIAIGIGFLAGGIWNGWTLKCAQRLHDIQPEIAAWKAAKKKGRSGRKLPAVTAVLGLVGRAGAFPCADSGLDHRIHFVDSNGAIAGVVSGWISDCIQTDVCVEHYDSKGNPGCKRYQRFSQKQPVHFVEGIMPRVEACGFHVPGFGTADWLKAYRAAERVANPGIEKNWWVEIKVTGLNVTRANETDASVMCLYDIGGVKQNYNDS